MNAKRISVGGNIAPGETKKCWRKEKIEILWGNGSCSGVRPTLYLDPSVYIIEGDGSMDTPFIIAL